MSNKLCKTLEDANKLQRVPFVLENAFLVHALVNINLCFSVVMFTYQLYTSYCENFCLLSSNNDNDFFTEPSSTTFRASPRD